MPRSSYTTVKTAYSAGVMLGLFKQVAKLGAAHFSEAKSA